MRSKRSARSMPCAALTLALAGLLVACSPSQASPGTTPSHTDAASTPAPSAEPSQPVASREPTATPASVAVPTSGAWAEVAVGGARPRAREDHTWTVGEDGLIYLFGGRDGDTVFSELLAFDPEAGAWRDLALANQGPARRFGHEAAWIPGRGLAVWAGQAGTAFFDDLWLFDPSTSSWQRLPNDGPAPIPRYGSCSGVGPDGRLWVSHGFTADGARFADTAAYDFEAMTWTAESPLDGGPVERCLHSCWWTSDGRLALYGGQTTGVAALGDLWHLTPGAGGDNAWAEADAAGPAARQLPAVARLGSITVIVGGRGVEGEPLADIWVLPDGQSFVHLEATGEAPSARSGAALVHDVARDRLLLFGGLADDELADVWELTLR